MSDKPADLATNKKAFFQYEILDTLETGIVLQGTEIKSLRDHGGSLQEAYVKVIRDEVWLVGCHIAPYRFGNIHNHEERRDRKLLLHKREIARLRISLQEKGLTIVPIAIYLNKNGIAKVKIGIAKGKKLADKRETIKEREDKRSMQKALKSRQYD